MADIVIYQDSQNNASQSILGAGLHTDTAQKPEIPDYQTSEQSVDEMRCHYLEIMNPEVFMTQEPMDEAYKREQTKQAEAWLVQDGYRLIATGEIAPSLFQ